MSCIGSYGDRYRSNGSNQSGGNLLDDLDSFAVAPLRPGPPVIKNFYVESSLITSRPQVNSKHSNRVCNHSCCLSH
jgi:hypothetical protein